MGAGVVETWGRAPHAARSFGAAPSPTFRREQKQGHPALVALGELGGDGLPLLPVTPEEAIAA